MKISNIQDLKGKTISDSSFNNDSLYLKFDDNTYVVFEINDITEGFGYSQYKIGICNDNMNMTDETLIELGIITKQEYTDALLIKEKEHEKIMQQYKKDQQEYLDKIDYETYKKLKERFE